MRPILAFILALALLAGGWSATVYASLDALPGDPLYGVKTLSEDVRVDLTSGDQARADLLLDLASRRVDEMASMKGSNAGALARQQAQVESALQIAVGLGDAETQEVLAHARDVFDQGLRTTEGAPDLADARALLTAERGLIQIGLDDQSAFREQFQNGAAQASWPPLPLPTPPFTATLPITGTWPAPPPDWGTPLFTATLPITGTRPAPPPDWGTPPFTATLPMTGTWPAPPPAWGTPPFTATLPITGTRPAPPPDWGTPPFTATLPMTGTRPAPSPDWSTPPLTATIPTTGTLPAPPAHPTESNTPAAESSSAPSPQPKSPPAASQPQPKSTPAASQPQPKSAPAAPQPQPQPPPPQPPRGPGK